MLKTPKYGWSEITIGNWKDRCSYLDDVPYDLLKTMGAADRAHVPKCVKFDAEGWEYIIVFDMFETHIITYTSDGDYTYVAVEINLKDLIRELIADIRRDIVEWANWGYNMSNDEIEERKSTLESWCRAIENRT